MRALLDVNVLVALLDAAHVHHGAASSWLDRNLERGWASCPITQNGCLRVLSSENYPRPQPVAAVAARLREATATRFHEFWTDDFSVLDTTRLDHDWLLRTRQVSDGYLLAMAVRRDGVFVTLDRGIDLNLVRGAEARHVLVI
ncbi:MAG: VapC toxin family PIN domain ribonuclease [Proteobacteria bacterium]|jgi:toxin-antitoxin system PIN domain toxin|nr:VapC toxin family PIN domain ribonuclease [Pseudomonadota bacterium]MBK7115466.1 VapC toxin family PIN domain ribonuclease [Pseudomonadota bacterium]MBK9253519.1 VapC toxin family PIN domain ribonuclease [Pseudomonadota bacterium]